MADKPTIKDKLQEIDFRKYKDHQHYRSLVSIIREKIFPKFQEVYSYE